MRKFPLCHCQAYYSSGSLCRSPDEIYPVFIISGSDGQIYAFRDVISHTLNITYLTPRHMHSRNKLQWSRFSHCHARPPTTQQTTTQHTRATTQMCTPHKRHTRSQRHLTFGHTQHTHSSALCSSVAHQTDLSRFTPLTLLASHFALFVLTGPSVMYISSRETLVRNQLSF